MTIPAINRQPRLVHLTPGLPDSPEKSWAAATGSVIDGRCDRSKVLGSNKSRSLGPSALDHRSRLSGPIPRSRRPGLPLSATAFDVADQSGVFRHIPSKMSRMYPELFDEV
jgi:hypothetical protein